MKIYGLSTAAAFVLALLFLAPAPATAQDDAVYWGSGHTVELVLNGDLFLQSLDQGWYRYDGVHSTSNRNYYTGFHTSSGGWLRSFFVFDIPDIDIFSAALYIHTASVYGGPNTVNLFSVDGSVDALVGGTGGTAMFDDLGTGTAYGSRIYTSADDNTWQTFDLNTTAVSAANGMNGGYFAMGGALSDDPTAGTGEVVPEPMTILLMGTGLAGIGLVGIRRRREESLEA